MNCRIETAGSVQLHSQYHRPAFLMSPVVFQTVIFHSPEYVFLQKPDPWPLQSTGMKRSVAKRNIFSGSWMQVENPPQFTRKIINSRGKPEYFQNFMIFSGLQ